MSKPLPNKGKKFIASLALGLIALFSHSPLASAQVKLGIDVLAEKNFAPLRGKRVGLITNQTGVNRNKQRTRVILHRAPQVNLVALFTPEHGLDGTEKAGKYVANRRDPVTGVMAYSLYGKTRKPTPAMLQGIDVLVFDMQDIGVRSYTYVSTMGLCMEAAGEQGIEFMVLDRPNPLGGRRVEGPLRETKWKSFVGFFPTPYVHGMTVGELARMANSRRWVGSKSKLEIIPLKGWQRKMTWADTGLPWVPTSPNIPYKNSPFYYLTTGITGSLSGPDIGIGTKSPFEIAAGPGVDAHHFTRYLQSLNTPGISFKPYWNKTKKTAGSRILINPDTPTNLTALDICILDYLNRNVRPGLFRRTSSSQRELFHKVYGSSTLQHQLEKRVNPGKIIASWKKDVTQFRQDRKPYLLYR